MNEDENWVEFEGGIRYVFNEDVSPGDFLNSLGDCPDGLNVIDTEGPWFRRTSPLDLDEMTSLWERAYDSEWEHERERLGDDLDEYLCLMVEDRTWDTSLTAVVESADDYLAEYLEEEYGVSDGDPVFLDGLAEIDWDAVTEHAGVIFLEGRFRTYVVSS